MGKQTAIDAQTHIERLALVLDALHEGVWDWPDLAAPRLWWSPRFYALIGYQPGEVEPTMDTFFSLVHPEDRVRLQASRDQHVQSVQPVENEYRMRTKTGDYRWFHVRGQTLGPRNGPPTRMVGTLRDITALKQAEAALRASENKYRLLHESMRDAFVKVDVDGRFIDCNSAYETLLGYTAQELQRMTYHEVTPKKWRAMETRIVHEQVMTRGYSDVYEKEYRRKDGRIIPVEIRAILLRNAEGEPEFMWGIARDITERKRAEKALKKSRAELKRRVHERTADLAHTNKNLHALAEKLAFAEEAERQRVARLVHDSLIQTLSLAHIRLGGTDHALRELGRTKEADQVLEVRELLKEAIRQGRLVVSDLAPPMLYELGLLAALQSVTERFAIQHGVAISVREKGTVKALDMARRSLFFQCGRELLINAIKHAHATTMDLELRWADHQLILIATDNGVGFDPAGRPAQSATDPSGFGLFHIRQRVESLGGQMELASAPGQGARISIRVPLTSV